MAKKGAFSGDPGLYLITDRRITGDGLTDAVGEALKAGVRTVQLREKDMKGRELLTLALELREKTSEFGARLIINDRIDVAILSRADGVHLGAASINARDARLMLGKTGLIGVSTHSVEEAVRAEADGADFITFGPIYFTKSKEKWGSPLGTSVLKEVKKRVQVPVYGIGGINKERVKEVIGAGAEGVAVISAVLGNPDILRNAKELISELEEGRNYN